MSKYVLPGSDLDHDIERLDHEHPDEMAAPDGASPRGQVVGVAGGRRRDHPPRHVALHRARVPHPRLGGDVGVRQSVAAHSSVLIAIAIARRARAIARPGARCALPIAAPIRRWARPRRRARHHRLLARGSTAGLWMSGVTIIFSAIGPHRSSPALRARADSRQDPARQRGVHDRGFIRSARATGAMLYNAVRACAVTRSAVRRARGRASSASVR